MTALLRGENSYFMGSRAYLVDDENRETASDWASKHIKSNPALKWVLGRYVQADTPNNNMQAWHLEDLRMKQPTINNAPMNMVHQAKHIVGSFVANEMIYPIASEASGASPFVETLGVFWKYYFPEEYQAIEEAHSEGSLFFSMECVARTLTFEDPGTGTKEEFAYAGPHHDSYGDWNENRNAIRWLNDPHFLAGALIVPPVRPGWSNAEIKSLSSYVDDHQSVVESLYMDVAAEAPHLSEKQIEGITLGLIAGQIDEAWTSMIKNSNSPDDLSKNVVDIETTVETLVESHPGGGDMSKTYTEEEFAAAMKPLQDELDALKEQANAEAVDAKLSELDEAHKVELEELRKELDDAVLKAQASQEAHDAVVTWLEATAAEQAETDEREARKDDRLTKIAAVAEFPQEFVEKNTERWIAMSDEDFDLTVEGYKVTVELAKAASDPKSDKEELHQTGMHASHEEGEPSKFDTVKGLMRYTRQGRGFDPRTV